MKSKKLKNFEFREVTEFFTYPSPVGVKYIRGCRFRDSGFEIRVLWFGEVRRKNIEVKGVKDTTDLDAFALKKKVTIRISQSYSPTK